MTQAQFNGVEPLPKLAPIAKIQNLLEQLRLSILCCAHPGVLFECSSVEWLLLHAADSIISWPGVSGSGRSLAAKPISNQLMMDRCAPQSSQPTSKPHHCSSTKDQRQN